MNDEYAGVEYTTRAILDTLKAARDCGVPLQKIEEIAKHPDLSWYLQPASAQRELAEITKPPAATPPAPGTPPKP